MLGIWREGRRKRVEGSFRRRPISLALAVAVALPVQPAVTLPLNPSFPPSAGWSSFRRHLGFRVWGHHQVWLPLDRVTKNCLWWSKSGPAPFRVPQQLSEALVRPNRGSSRRDSCPYGSLLLATQSRFVPESRDPGLGSKSISVETFI